MTLEVYTDGSCSEPNGAGGYAILYVGSNGIKKVSKGVESTTNNRMELMAVLEAIETYVSKFKDRYDELIVYSDSAYVINAFNQNWIDNWVLNGWKNKKGNEVKNIDLWKRAIPLRKHNVKFYKVKGHSDNTFNNMADELAQSAMKKVKEQLNGGDNKCK